MTRFLKVALLSVLLAIGLNANDFLAKATGGVLSDASVGIKQLNETELQEILGGYAFIGYQNYPKVSVLLKHMPLLF